MIARGHPIALEGRKMDLEELDSYLRGQGLANYHGISTDIDGIVYAVVTNDHTDSEYGRMHVKVKDNKEEWDKTHKKDGTAK